MVQFNNAVIFMASLAALAQGYVIPAGLENGVYEVRLNETGHLHPYYVGPGATTSSSLPRDVGRAALQARDQHGCTAHTLNSGDCDAAVNSLRSFCGGGKRYTSKIMLFTHNSVTAYTCDYSGGQLCFSSEAQTAYTQITNDCGFYRSGWWLFGSNKNYGYDVQGASICGNL